MPLSVVPDRSAPITSTLLAGKCGLVMGVTNKRSIAFGIAESLKHAGAKIALSYQDKALHKRVDDIAQDIEAHAIFDINVSNANSIEQGFKALADLWPEGIDFLVHGIAFSNKNELSMRFVETSAENFAQTLHISCYSLIAVARAALPLLQKRGGGSIITLTYQGAHRVVEHYNTMGVAKSALESTVRYLAHDLGTDKIRVNAISPGPMRTLSGAAIPQARTIYQISQNQAPLGCNGTLATIGGTAVYLVSDYGQCTTGGVVYVDGGYHSIGVLTTHQTPHTH